MAERTIRDLILEGTPSAPALDLGRVKRNVGKMVEQGAPENEIDAYISGEGTDIDTVKSFKAQPVDVATDMAKGFGYGANEGIDATLNMISAPIRAPVNYIANKLGYEGIPELQLARRANVAGPAETQAGRVAQTVGEVSGASVLPAGALLKAGQTAGRMSAPLLQQAGAAPAKFAGLEAASAGGSGLGVSYARENELGPTAELGFGLAGGLAIPNAVNMASRTVGGVKSGLDHAGRMIERARDPETAAYRDVADTGVKSGFDFDEALQSASPPRSKNLETRGFTQDDLADIVSRQMNGEHADDIVRDYAHLVDAKGNSLTAATARKYLQRYQDQNPVDLNMVDMAKIQRGTGEAMPLANQARADMAIADDPVAAGRLVERQRAQPGRVAEAVEQSGVEGRNFEDEIERLSGTARQEERTAYEAAHAKAQPVDLKPVIGEARRVSATRGGEISEKLNQAVDLFFEPALAQRQQSPATALRITELEERLAEAAASPNPSAKKIAWLERRLSVAKEQDEFGRPLKPQKLGEPITDLRRFLDQRRELDQMIATSKKDGKSTPLTAQLTEFRKRINDAGRRNNPALVEADAKFAENRTIERIMGRGGDLGKRLTPQSRQALREFGSMTPTQQELMRVSFERRLMDDALNVRRGNAAADQFKTDAFDQIVERLYPVPKSKKGPVRTTEQKVHERGQTLLKRLKEEAVTTETTRDVLSGSRTAPLADDMAELMEGPRAAADALTGRFTKILENLSNRLTRQIGQGAARERIRILTTTDPAQRLPMLRRLRDEAKTAGERRLLDVAIKQFAYVSQRPGAEIGTVAATTE